MSLRLPVVRTLTGDRNASALFGQRLSGWGSVAALVLAGMVLESCGGSTTGQPAEDVSSPPAIASAAGGILATLDRMESSLDSISFRGTLHKVVERGNDVLETREDLGADGTGQFAFELVEAISLPAQVDPFAFPITYENDAVFNWRFGMFRVRGGNRVLANYSVTVDGVTTPVVAGIPCQRILFERYLPFDDRPGRYEVDIDPTTGFVLAWREFDAMGNVFRSSYFETFTYGGDLSDMTLRGRQYAATQLDLESPLDGQAGFKVHKPDILPIGFEFVTAERQTVPPGLVQGQSTFLPTGPWVKFLCTDGLETISFMHSESSPATFNAGATVGGTGVPSPETVARVRIQGTWRVSFGEFSDVAYVVTGRLSMDDITLIIASAF